MSQEFENKEALNEEPELEAGEQPQTEEAPVQEKSEDEQLEECRARLCAACNVAAEANAVKLRALAEMDNFKKRVRATRPRRCWRICCPRWTIWILRCSTADSRKRAGT